MFDVKSGNVRGSLDQWILTLMYNIYFIIYKPLDIFIIIEVPWFLVLWSPFAVPYVFIQYGLEIFGIGLVTNNF